MGGDTEQMAQLEARVERLENLESIRDSLHRYAHAIDYGRQSDWVDCFTKDGRFVFKFLPGKSPYAGLHFKAKRSSPASSRDTAALPKSFTNI